MTQLLVKLERWIELLDAGNIVGVIYLDFRKAFNTVLHRRLIKKLGAFGLKAASSPGLRTSSQADGSV